jgi:antitoxin component YwqK of YwqJK toxin-antitoxin module
MKKVILAFLVFSFLNTFAQKQNEMGFFVNEDNSLFSGVFTFTKNNLKHEVIIVNGEINGLAKIFNADQKLLEEGRLINNTKDGKWLRYNSKGNVINIAFFKLGKKDSTWLVFDDNQVKRMEMHYKNGEKTGEWKSWNEAGDLVAVKAYVLN